MNNIISKDNNLYKKFKSLKYKKARRKEGLFLIEGEKLINEAKKLNIDFEFIISCSKEKLTDNKKSILLKENLFKQISTKKTPQDLIAIAKNPQNTSIDFNKKKILILDGLNNPLNAGTLIRTAVATGYENIITINGALDFFSPKIIGSSAGQVFKIKSQNYKDGQKLIEDLNAKSFKIFSADMCGIFYKNIDFSKKHALILGNESTGVSDFLLKNSDQKIYIPMKNNVESLNVAVSGSFLMIHSFS
ncbi:MAG: RNA methyltransferase [Clostridiales Family XIII bacterium]|jgi:TrmH family RNA methyltransferase|nr:RNA methyltransferase [Clostridiales Family XIII bacterium]